MTQSIETAEAEEYEDEFEDEVKEARMSLRREILQRP